METPGSSAPHARLLAWHRRIRPIVDVLIVALLLLAAATGLLYWYLKTTQPRVNGVVHLAALHGPAEIVRDLRGIAHIQAQDVHDAYLAEGYAMAQDRLWQMDLLRRTAEGRLAEIFGSGAIEIDHAHRVLGLGRIAAAETAHLTPEDKDLLDAFTSGVNMYIVSRGWRLPMEFRILRYRPDLWRDQDTLALAAYMYQQLASDYEFKVEREIFQAKLGADVVKQIFPDRSPWDIIPGAPIPTELGPQPPPAAHGKGRAAAPAYGADFADGVWGGDEAAAIAAEPGGSNAWVLSGGRSFSGKPILANDPHLDFTVPGIWWAAELTAPGLHVVGVTLAGSPGIIIGHNDAIGWGVTAARADVQDLYRETVDRQGRVLTRGGWVPLGIWRERLAVRHAHEIDFDVAVTPHGPIVGKDDAGPLSLAWSLYARGSLQVISVIFQIDRAQNWQDFESALARFPGPALNFMYADTAGHIGYQMAGWTPIRPANDDGSMPLPGATGEYEWKGWIPFEQLPHVFDPPAGLLVTANGRTSPDNFKYTISTVWDAPNRTRRIYQLLGQLHLWNASAMTNLQTDVVSEQDRDFARALVDAAAAETAAGRPPDANTQQAVEMLRGFRGLMARAANAPTLAVETRDELLYQVLSAQVGPALARAYRWDESSVFVQALLAQRAASWLPPDYRSRGWNAFLVACLTSVVQRHTLNSADLHWGRFETLFVAHPVYSHLPILRDYADLGPVEINGSPLTVKQARNTLLGDQADLGPSMRAIYNLADWDRSTLTLFSGESGELFNPHYRDNFRPYLQGQALPLWFSPQAVAAHAAANLHLVP